MIQVWFHGAVGSEDSRMMWVHGSWHELLPLAFLQDVVPFEFDVVVVCDYPGVSCC